MNTKHTPGPWIDRSFQTEPGQMTKQQQNVLDAIRYATLRRNGEVKRRIDCSAYDGRTVASLLKRGLIDYKIETIHGTGYAAIAKATGGQNA